MSTIGIIVGSTRPGRYSEQVAHWVLDRAQGRESRYELVDLAEVGLPHLDEPVPASAGQYAHEHTQRWSTRIAALDGFVFVTPEYNHGIPGVLKNAIDYLYREWNDKAAGIVSYGVTGGARAAEQLRQIAAELRLATVRAHVPLSFHHDFREFTTLAPEPHQESLLIDLLGEVEAWTGALEPLRKAA